MSDDPTTPALPPSERARIEPAPPKRLDALPIMYLVGFVILASALIYLWQHPTLPRGAAQEAARVAALRQDVDARRKESEALAARLAALEARPVPVAPNLAPLEARLGALEQRPAAAAAPAPDLGPVEARIAALEGKPAPVPVDLGPVEGRVAALEAKPAPPPVDLSPLEGRIGALDAKLGAQAGTVSGRLDQVDARAAASDSKLAAVGPRLEQLEARLAAAEAQGKQNTAGLGAIGERAQRTARMQIAAVALAAGQRLGDIPGAPPALTRFANDPPPTESSLRVSFETAARAAQQASLPAYSDNQPFASRLWTRAQQSLTVRQGDHVLVGDPSAGVIGHARQLLEAGDLPGVIKTLDALTGPAKAAMAGWVGQAQSVIDARAAVAAMAAG